MSRIEPERWAELRASFDALVELDSAARAERLRTIGSSDPATRAALEELLAADAAADARLARVEAVLGTGPARDGDDRLDTLGLVGRTVAHFHVLEAIAAGGMGIVYRAQDTQLARTVALKFPLPEHRLDRHARDRFLREARTAAGVDHPNLCSIYEAGETSDGHLYIAMALYEGETLRARLAREGALPIADALAIAAQLARGLGAAHRAGIVHRDLKPGNIVLLPEGGLKILDFGLAHVSDVSLTVSRAAMGTVSYMAPEQVRGEAVDARADLWALGVILYEMLTGRRPFDGEHEIAIAHAVVHREPRRVADVRPEVSGALERIVQRLLAKDPARRSATAEDVATALAASAPARSPPGFARRIGAALRRRRRSLAGAALLVLVLGGLGYAAGLLPTRADPVPADPLLLGVLPLQGPGADTASEYLAIGLTDALVTQLARVHALAVPTEMSTYEYRGTTKPWRQIAAELGADALVRGHVARRGDSVRVTLELLDPGRGRRRWTRSYVRSTLELVTLQRDAVQDIVAALRLDPGAAERALLAQVPTSSPEAYDLYLRARAVLLRGPPVDIRRVTRENLRLAQSLYVRARELDPDFALARARLAMSHLYSAVQYDTTRARREQARLEAETALRTAPALPEAHDALAQYWAMERDPERAVAELQRALAGIPNSGDFHLNLGVSYRNLGRWEEAIAAMERAMRFEPRYAGGFLNAGMTYNRTRQYLKGARALEQFIALQPPTGDRYQAELTRGFAFIRAQGTPDSLAAALQRIPPEWDENGMATWARLKVLQLRRRHAEALALLEHAPHAVSRDGPVFRPVPLMRAELWQSLGHADHARREYEAARRVLVDSLAASPERPDIMIALALAYAGLGRKAEALAQTQRALELAPLTRTNHAATAYMGGAIEVYVVLGEHDRALELLELLLGVPAGREVSVPLLRVEPRFDPLRSDPRFTALLERYGNP